MLYITYRYIPLIMVCCIPYKNPYNTLLKSITPFFSGRSLEPHLKSGDNWQVGDSKTSRRGNASSIDGLISQFSLGSTEKTQAYPIGTWKNKTSVLFYEQKSGVTDFCQWSFGGSHMIEWFQTNKNTCGVTVSFDWISI